MAGVSGQGSPGICDICGRAVEANGAFVNIGPTDWSDPSKPKSRRWVPAGTDIHGWTPFVGEHPPCFAEVNGQDAPHRQIDVIPAQTHNDGASGYADHNRPTPDSAILDASLVQTDVDGGEQNA